jgi:hypothetical protein
MSGTPHTHYFPAVKARAGELQALSHLDAAARSRVTPIIDIPVDEDTDVQTVSAEIEKLVRSLPNTWDNVNRLIVNASGTDGIVDPVGREVVGQMHDDLRGTVLATPTVGLSSSPGYRAEVSRIVSLDGLGVCVRVVSDDLGSLPTLQSDLVGLLIDLGVVESDADLVIDLGHIEANTVNVFVSLFSALVANLTKLANWHSFVLLSGAFPANLNNVVTGRPSSIPRLDAALWSRVVSASPARLPSYGDYGVSHPMIPTVLGFRSSANLRYTGDDSWTVLKAPFRASNQGFFAICATLAGMTPSPLRPAGYSWGDQHVHRCSIPTGGPGAGREWKAWSTSHHLATVLDRLATVALHESLANHLLQLGKVNHLSKPLPNDCPRLKAHACVSATAGQLLESFFAPQQLSKCKWLHIAVLDSRPVHGEL